MISKKSLSYLTILLIGISTMFHPTFGKHRVIYMKSDNSRPVPLSETKRDSTELKRPLSMTIYYETLCPDSLDFLQDQLLPVLESLHKPLDGNPGEGSNRLDLVDPGSLLDIQFIPYGKAVTLEKSHAYTFLCQHGPLECEGNRLHSCTLDALAKSSQKNTNPDPTEPDDVHKTTKLVKFLVCTMKFLITPRDRDDPSKTTSFPKTNLKSNNLTSFSGAALDHCFSDLSNSTQLRTDVESCLQQDRGQGSYLLMKHGQLTHSLNPRLYFVPWITYNGVWTKKNLEGSQIDVKKVLCSLTTPNTLKLYDVLECSKYFEEHEQHKSAEKMAQIIRKVVGDDHEGRHDLFQDQGVNRRDGRGVGVAVGSGESAQNKRRILMRPRPRKHGRDRRGFLHANNDMGLGSGGAAWRWRTNVHSNPGMEWKWRRPLAAPGMAH